MQFTERCPLCGSNDLETNHTGFAPGHDEDLQEWCMEPDCTWSRREYDNSAAEVSE